jgi:hypothetical protein
LSDNDHPETAPPPGEELHLPGPSLKPFLCAIAITLVVIGTTIDIILSIIGLVALVIIVWLWIGDSRRDIAELPESHH